MEKITRNVRDLDGDERRLYENVVGHRLAENQQVILQVITLHDALPEEELAGSGSGQELPDWTKVYDGLTDEEIADIEKIVLQRANLTRHFE